MAKLVACQLISEPDVEQNLACVDELLSGLTVDQPTLVVLPECFARFGGGDKGLLEVAEAEDEGPIQHAIAQMAKQYGVWIVAGTIPLKTSTNDKFAAGCLLFDNMGEQRARYDKIHMFDVNVSDNTGVYNESTYTQAGNRVVSLDTPFGKLGLAVCYDLRFPGLFQAMDKPDIVVLPSAFTYVTGEAHWTSLLRARAIENQCYVVASNQGGTHANGRQTYGHSCIISPWGDTLDQIEQGIGLVQAELDTSSITRVRAKMPVHQHNKFRSNFV